IRSCWAIEGAMARTVSAALRQLPSVDEVLRTAVAADAAVRYGRTAVVAAVRATLAAARANGAAPGGSDHVAAAGLTRLEIADKPNLRPVFNLTGTVLHTNLGRALWPDAAIEAAQLAMRNAVALEFDLGAGHRGDRDDLIHDLVCEL